MTNDEGCIKVTKSFEIFKRDFFKKLVLSIYESPNVVGL